jgi:hypothetical protein
MTAFFLVVVAVFLASMAARLLSLPPSVAGLGRGIGVAAAILALLGLAHSSPDGVAALAGGSATAALAILISAWS